MKVLRSQPNALSWLTTAELLAVALAIPVLLFPRGCFPWLGLALVVLAWVLRGIVANRWLVHTPLDRPILVILIAALVGLFVSVDLDLSLPKFHGVALGVIVYYAAARNMASRRRFMLGIGLLVASIIPISLLGLVGTEWVYKYPQLTFLYRFLPRLITQVQTSQIVTAGFNPNQIGGTLAFLLPLPIALLLGASLTTSRKLVIGAAILMGLCVFALASSRSALMGLGVAIVMLLIWRWRVFGVATASAVVTIAVGASLFLGAEDWTTSLLLSGAASPSDVGSLAARREIWNRAFLMVRDFPFTGIGLNTFPVALSHLYPLTQVSPDAAIPHAHNLFIQTAVDLGLGGFLGFLGLCSGIVATGWRACRRIVGGEPSARAERAALVGLLAGLLAYLVAGLTDAITLGAKPTVALWFMIALIVSADDRLRSTRDDPTLWPSTGSSGKLGLAGKALESIYWGGTFLLIALGCVVVGLRLL